jgi:hypothetical protein
MKRILATAAAHLIIAPLWPLWGIVVLGELLHDMEWPMKVIDKAERLDAWGRE